MIATQWLSYLAGTGFSPAGNIDLARPHTPFFLSHRKAMGRLQWKISPNITLKQDFKIILSQKLQLVRDFFLCSKVLGFGFYT